MNQNIIKEGGALRMMTDTSSGGGETPVKTAAAYIRVSTDDQLTYSPDSQLLKIREYANHAGFLLPPAFLFREDEGISGRGAEKRPEFQRMIRIARQKPRPFDVILVWKFSRFARSRQDSIVYKSILRRQCGIDIISVTEPIGGDKMSILMEAMIEAMDEYYSVNLAEEVRRGMGEKVRRGEPVASPPIGYQMENKHYITDPETAPIVYMIFQSFLRGSGCREIALHLNSMGLRTGRGGLWETRAVEYVLSNPVYTGKIRWNPNGHTGRRRGMDTPAIPGTHPPLISQDEWNLVQARLEWQKAASPPHSRINGTGNPFRGLLRCSTCGASLSRSSKRSLQCSGYTHGRCAVSHSISLPGMTALVLAALRGDLRTDRFWLSPSIRAGSTETTLMARQLARERQKLSRIREAYESGVDTLSEYRNRKVEIENRIHSLEMENIKARCAPPQENSALKHGLCLLSLLQNGPAYCEEQNVALHAIIQKIVFDRRNNRLEIYYYEFPPAR